MKKYFKTLVMATMGLFALVACEDVPAPYDIPNGETAKTLATVNFLSGQGAWTTVDVSGMTNIWSHSSQYGMVASGFKNSTNNDAVADLISGKIDLTKTTDAKIVLKEAINKIGTGIVNEMMTVAASVDGNNWTVLEAKTRPAGSSWTYQEDEFDVSAFDGKVINLRLRYTSTSEAAGTWEIESVTLKGFGEGSIEGGETPEPPTGDGDGSKEKPFTVDQVYAMYAANNGIDMTDQWVEGYIVGSMNNSSSTNLSNVNMPGTDHVATNMVIAKEAGATNYTECLAVQLPTGAIRTALNVKDNPSNIGKKVLLKGQIVKYCGAQGLKAVSEYVLEGSSIPDPQEAINVSCAEAASIALALEANNVPTTETYCVTGYITKIGGNVSRNQQTFWMADTKDGGEVFQAYWANLPEGVTEFVVGSKVKITGPIMKYNTTPEIKNATVEIIEQGEGGGDGDGDKGGTKGSGTLADPYNVAGALAYITTLSATDKPEALVYTKGKISEVVKMGTSGSIQFKMADEGAENSLLVYYCDNLGKTSFTALTDLKVGDEVIVCGKVQNYNGNTPEYSSGAYLVSLNGKTEGEGGDTGGGGDKGDANAYTIDLSYTLGTNAYDNGAATINGVAVDKTIKIGTSTKAGSFTLDVPAGKLSFYAITWKGAGTADVQVGGETVTVKANDGATGNAPYTITVTDGDKYEVNVPSATTLEVTSDKRIIFFGIKSSK